MKKLYPDEKYIGGDLPGFFGVLHTWGRTLQFHPHIHYVVPGGAFSTKDRLWHPSRIDFFLSVYALSRIYKVKFRDLMLKKGLLNQIPPEVWHMDWNVNVQPVGNAEQSIRYLSRYVFQVAISDHHIVKVEDGQVTFRYRKPGNSRDRRMTVNAMEFIRRFLQHVLPTGFMKVRYYGFLNPNSSVNLIEIKGVKRLLLSYLMRGLDLDEKGTRTDITFHLFSCFSPFLFYHSPYNSIFNNLR